MSKHFKVVKIFRSITPKTLLDSHVPNYTNVEAQGQIYAIDTKGDLFRCVLDLLVQESDTFRTRHTKRPQSLYRDYWRCVSNANDAPYKRSILEGDNDVLWAVKE